MQEESGSVTNTVEQNEDEAPQNTDVKNESKKSAKKKEPKIPTVTEIVEKEGTAPQPESGAAQKETDSDEAQKQAVPAEASKEVPEEAAEAVDEPQYPEEDEAEDEATARARANLNLDSETALIETILFLESEPQNSENLAKISQLSEDVVKEALARLREKYANADSGIEIAEIIGGWMLVPKKESFDLVKEKYGKRNEGRLSKAAIETLSIIAYSQPITRAEIESIRHDSWLRHPRRPCIARSQTGD